jgi:hypothetical protein
MTHFDIVIATPANSFTPAYVHSLVKTIKAIEERNLTWTFLSHSSSLVNVAREATIEDTKQFDLGNCAPMGGKHTYNKIISIDSDISWTPEQFFKLYDRDLDVVSGVYLTDNGKQTSVHLNNKPMQYEDFSWRDTLFRCDGFGFGFLAIRQGVFESMPRAWFQPVLQELTNQETQQTVALFMGEDLSWCFRARHLGYFMWCDPTIKVTHHKMQEVKFDGIA